MSEHYEKKIPTVIDEVSLLKIIEGESVEHRVVFEGGIDSTWITVSEEDFVHLKTVLSKPDEDYVE